MEINKSTISNKSVLLQYFRDRAKEILNEIITEFGRNNYKKITQKLQPALRESRNNIIRVILQKSEREKWSKEEKLGGILMLYHTTNVVMIEFRHLIWPYEYMTFSRRIGELWESFVSVCFHHPVANDLEIVVPPLFSEVREKLHQEVTEYIDSLPLELKEKEELKSYYQKIWLLVDAGEIKLELDMHCKKGDINYNIDFKSGFSSNEKGNTNRLLVVASIYRNIIDLEYQNLMMVRSEESENNHYLQTLKNSGLWDVSCSTSTYLKLGEIVEFNLKRWIEDNIDWANDLNTDVIEDFKNTDLMKYLKW
jgi:hypothetical protein